MNHWMALFLRGFFFLLYQPFAWMYDWVAAVVSLGMWQGWVMAVLPYLRSSRILEIGHGPGHLQVALHRMGVKGIGLDRSPQMGRQARRRLLRAGLPPALVRALAQQLPFADASIEQVVATFPTEYIVHPHTLDEIHRVLSEHGQLIVLPVAWITGRGLPQRAAQQLFHITGQAPSWDDRYLEIFSQAGFHARVEILQLPQSRVALIIADKDPTPND